MSTLDAAIKEAAAAREATKRNSGRDGGYKVVYGMTDAEALQNTFKKYGIDPASIPKNVDLGLYTKMQNYAGGQLDPSGALGASTYYEDGRSKANDTRIPEMLAQGVYQGKTGAELWKPVEAWNDSQRGKNSGIGGVSNFLSGMAESIGDNPLANAVITAAAATAGVPPSVTAGLLGANAGTHRDGELGKGLLTAGASYLGGTGLNNYNATGSVFGGGETAAMGLNNVSAATSPYSLGGGTATFGQGSALSTGNAIGGTQVVGMGGGTGLTLGGSALPTLAAMGGGTGLLAGGMGSAGAVGATGATAGALGGGAAATGGSLLETIGNAVKPVTTAVKGINDLTGGNLGGIIGGLAGAAASGDTTTSDSKDPWGPAQSYLKDNLAQNQRMQDYYSANPFSQEQKQAYQGLLNTNANGLSNAGNFNQIAQNFMGSNRGLMGQMPTLNQGVTAPQVDWTKYANIGKGG